MQTEDADPGNATQKAVRDAIDAGETDRFMDQQPPPVATP
jgi:hypothetical protein